MTEAQETIVFIIWPMITLFFGIYIGRITK